LTTASPQLDALTVTDYAARLARALRQVGGAVIEGEVQRPRRSASGILWFSLTDGEATLSCKVFRAEASRLEHVPREGDLVQVAVERPDLWPQAGRLDLIVAQVRLAGEGELLRRRRELLARLAAEGLCDPARRRPLPRFPRAVGVIAGAGSDGMSDVLRALRDRWPAVHAVTCASVVQGKAAPLAVIDALARLQEHPLVDVIVLARGGGSVHDLACFDDERLCRALFACAVPVVCAIGHTDNNPVCNHVAWAAFTPSRSAELVVPSAVELRQQIEAAGARVGAVSRRLELAGERLLACGARLERARTMAREREQAITRLVADSRAALERASARRAELLARLGERAAEGARRGVAQAERELRYRAGVIAAGDLRRRGWTLAATDAGEPLRSAAQLRPGMRLVLRLADGRAGALVEDVDAENGSDDG
jgi:exodeoxyribonuclease VII large subunit